MHLEHVEEETQSLTHVLFLTVGELQFTTEEVGILLLFVHWKSVEDCDCQEGIHAYSNHDYYGIQYFVDWSWDTDITVANSGGCDDDEVDGLEDVGNEAISSAIRDDGSKSKNEESPDETDSDEVMSAAEGQFVCYGVDTDGMHIHYSFKSRILHFVTDEIKPHNDVDSDGCQLQKPIVDRLWPEDTRL